MFRLSFMTAFVFFFFFKQKTAYEMRISDWSSDVCSSDLADGFAAQRGNVALACLECLRSLGIEARVRVADLGLHRGRVALHRSEAIEHRPPIGRASCRERVCQYV